MAIFPWLVFGMACGVLVYLGFHDKAQARKKAEREGRRSGAV